MEIKKIKKMRIPTEGEIAHLQIENFIFEDEMKLTGKKLILLGLENTLVHLLNLRENKNVHICNFDKILKMITDDKVEEFGINIRPYLREFIEGIKNEYIITIFTKLPNSHADAILDVLDPDNKLFDFRLYRQNCYKISNEDEDFYIKDLRVFKNISPTNIVIVDNSVMSFAFNLNNIIPILPFVDNKGDIELKNLVIYLKYLYKCENIMEENKKIMEKLLNTISDVSDYYSPSVTEEEKSIEKAQISGNERGDINLDKIDTINTLLLKQNIVQNNFDSSSSNDSRSLMKCIMILNKCEQNIKGDGVYNTINSQSSENNFSQYDESYSDKKGRI
jgi:Dullard-like phosphatase family protein